MWENCFESTKKFRQYLCWCRVAIRIVIKPLLKSTEPIDKGTNLTGYHDFQSFGVPLKPMINRQIWLFYWFWPWMCLDIWQPCYLQNFTDNFRLSNQCQVTVLLTSVIYSSYSIQYSNNYQVAFTCLKTKSCSCFCILD